MFVTFEGIEGSSKSTQVELLSKFLTAKCIPHIKTKEPGTPLIDVCGKIRHILLNPDNNMCHKTELFLYLADRAEHVEKCIKPALQDNRWVISDRYMDSTIVYQSIGRGLGKEIKPLLDYAVGGTIPDLVFVMDLPVEVGLNRAKKSNKEFKNGDRIERESVLFHQSLRNGFLDLAKNSERHKMVNAEKPIMEIHNEIVSVIEGIVK